MTTEVAITTDFSLETLDLQQLTSCDLVVALEDQGLTYLVRDPQQRVVALKSFQGTDGLPFDKLLHTIKQNDPLLGADYFTKQMLVPSPRWLIAPNEHLKSGHEQELLRVLHEVDPQSDAFLSDYFGRLKLATVFALPQRWVMACRRTFAAVQFIHLATQTVRLTERLQRMVQASALGVGILMNDRLAYCVYQGGKLQFINIFYPPSPDQVSEAIEHVHRTLQLDPSELRLFLTGRSPHRAQAQSYLQETAGALIMNPADFFPAQPALQEAGIQLHEYSYLYIPEA